MQLAKKVHDCFSSKDTMMIIDSEAKADQMEIDTLLEDENPTSSVVKQKQMQKKMHLLTIDEAIHLVEHKDDLPFKIELNDFEMI